MEACAEKTNGDDMNFEALKRLQELYAKLPRINCVGSCVEACGPILCTKLEQEVLETASHRKLDHRKTHPHSCTMLNKEGKCRAYDARPLVCRLFGLVPRMACPHGCQPERWLTNEDGWALLAAAERISAGEK